MTLLENTLFGERNKVAIAIERLQKFEPEDGYQGAFSGGKDSVVIKHLANLANLKNPVLWYYNLTTLDPPELVKFIKQEHPDVKFNRPKETAWSLFARKLIPPTRVSRYCCSVLKEQGGNGNVIVGVRWEESPRRKKRRMVEQCLNNKYVIWVHPILDWSTDDVWEFIDNYKISYCKLYDEFGRDARLGCIGCPMGKNQKKELERWPKYKEAYLRCFKQIIENRKFKNRMDGFEMNTPEKLMKWFCGEATRGNPDQTTMFE